MVRFERCPVKVFLTPRIRRLVSTNRRDDSDAFKASLTEQKNNAARSTMRIRRAYVQDNRTGASATHVVPERPSMNKHAGNLHYSAPITWISDAKYQYGRQPET